MRQTKDELFLQFVASFQKKLGQPVLFFGSPTNLVGRLNGQHYIRSTEFKTTFQAYRLENSVTCGHYGCHKKVTARARTTVTLPFYSV